MPKYELLVNGRNFLINYDGKELMHGFSAMRFVEAKDPNALEFLVMDILRNQLKALVRNDKSDTPMMYLEEITEIDSLEGCPIPGTSFAWYEKEMANN